MPVNRPVSRRSKLQLEVDTRWANSFGYRPVFVTVSSPTPTTADHLITVRLHIAGWGWHQGEVTVEQDFELPLGQTSVTTSVPCPHYRLDTQFCWWDVWVDGAKDRDLSLEEDVARSIMAAAFNPGAQAGVSCLVVGTGAQRTLMTPSTMQFDVLSITIGDMPRRWIEYSCFDIVSLSLSEVQVLSQSNPDAFQALRRWVRSGGQLWVSNVGAKFEELATLSKLLQLRPTVAELPADDVGEGITVVDTAEELPVISWRPVRLQRENQGEVDVTFQNVMTGRSIEVRDPQTIARLQRDPSFVIIRQNAESNPAPRRRRGAAESSRWFVAQPLGIGAVHALRGENDIALFAQGRKTITTNVGAAPGSIMGGNDPTVNDPSGDRMPPSLALGLRSARNWESRHGMAPNSANRDFANLLVPGVGLAPVTEFRVLITLFVLLIGPGNYWFLKRFRRSHLLVLTVPAAALVTTAALFSYAILSDGFGTQVRVHSYTTIDQRTGEAACWSRLSFYSGLAPGQGLTMPDDVTVYPISPGWNEGNADPNLGVERDLIWETNEAKMTRGWLRSRTPTQYLTIRARKSPHLLELLPADGKLRATNQLGSAIKFVVAADENGKLYGGGDLSVGQRTMLPPVERIAAIRDFRREYLANQPEVPPELLAPESDFALLEDSSQRRIYRQLGFSYSEDSLSKNLATEAVSKLAGLTTEPALNLTPRSYVAVTETGPEVVIGMPGVEEQASFHVVVGQW
jgi:hypothetical protein